MDKVRFDSERGVIDRSSSAAEINPFDLYALQAAVDIKKSYDAHITAISMGPQRSIHSLQDAWARGADDCILLTDKAFAGADTFATSCVLAAAINDLDYDLIICGEKTVDGDTAQVGAETAELLNIPHSNYVDLIYDISEGYITLATAELCGKKQSRRIKLPALISVNRTIAVPLLPGLKRKLDSISMEIKTLGLKELSGNITENDAGLKGSPTQVAKIIIPQAEYRSSTIFRDNPDIFIDAVKAVKKRISVHE